MNFLCLTWPCASFAHQFGDFEPRDRSAAKGPLFFNADYYAEHPIFKESSVDARYPVDIISSMALQRQAEDAFSETQDKSEAVKVQALTTGRLC